MVVTGMNEVTSIHLDKISDREFSLMVSISPNLFTAGATGHVVTPQSMLDYFYYLKRPNIKQLFSNLSHS